VRVLIVFCACLLSAEVAVGGQEAQPAGWTTGPQNGELQQAVRSPEVGPDRRVTFRLRAPQATEVTVSGEFQSGSVTMTKDSSGVWSVTVGPLKPEIYNYNFTIDGVKTIDPGNAEVKTGSTPSTMGRFIQSGISRGRSARSDV
jgi:Carbohydrate-binding module 48 (Isoamylase N-terminal domain)